MAWPEQTAVPCQRELLLLGACLPRGQGQQEQQRCREDGDGGQREERDGAGGRARGQHHVTGDGQGGDLGEHDAQPHVPDPVGGPVVVRGQLAVQDGAQHGPRSGQPSASRAAAVPVRAGVHGRTIGLDRLHLDRPHPGGVRPTPRLPPVGRG